MLFSYALAWGLHAVARRLDRLGDMVFEDAHRRYGAGNVR